MDIILKYFSEFTPRQLEQFTALEPLYKDWNEKINVISRKDIDSLYLKHVLHSLSIAAIVEFKPGSQVIDIGTGGGFPGIPLAIFFPEVQFHLVDSIAKKLKVVSSIESSETVTRFNPASFSDCAFFASSEPLVVRVRSSGAPLGVRNSASMPTSRSRFLRSSGSPPVRRSFSTPWATNRRAMRVISSNDKSDECGR